MSAEEATRSTQQAPQAQQSSEVSPLSRALAPTALSGDTYNAQGTGAVSGQGALGSANPLQSRPMEVYGGALLASMDQTGLRPDLHKVQAQIVCSILTQVLNQLQNVVTQIGTMLGGGQLPGGGNGAIGGGVQAPGGGYGGGGQVPGGGDGAVGGGGQAGGGYGGGVQTPGGGYGGGVQTPGGGYGGGVQVPGGGAGNVIPTNLRYQDMNAAQRNQMSGMDERQRGVLHLWGIQMGAAGHQDGGVLLNVLNNPSQFKPAEVQIAKELAAKEQAMYGGITGKSLDQEFFSLYKDLTGKDISQRYGNAPIRFAQGPVNMDNRLTGANGLNQFENEVLQLWGHSPLFTGGKIDGSILQYAMNSNNRMEVNLNQNDLQSLYNADLASDGVLNGDSLENAMIDVLDRVYMGAPSASADRTMNDALQEAALRRDGLLPPPTRPAAGTTPQGPNASAPLDAIAQNQPKKTGGSCPFIGKAA